jgi:integrase
MTVSISRDPKYRHYKPKNLGVVRINGKDRYLGKYNTPESWEKYHRLIAEWLANGRAHPVADPADLNCRDDTKSTIDDVILRYWRFAKSHYVRNGEPTKEVGAIRIALRPLRKLYGSTAAASFGPKCLKAVRQHLIESGLSRRVVNDRIGRIRRAFKWAVGEELVPPSLYHGLQAVAGLTFGRSKARETEPVRPVPDLHVAMILPFVSPVVAAMIKLQRLSGMRAGEIVIMRPCDIETSGEVWIYEPSDHKGRWRGHDKLIPLGPEAQRILQPYMDRDGDAFLFSPHEAETWRLEHRPPYYGRQRKTKVYPCELKRRQKLKDTRRMNRKPKRPKRDRYDTNSYRRAIEYGLVKAKKAGFTIPHWHPHQLRHNRATEVRRQYGVEAAQVALGHSKADVTQIYAERNLEQARQIAKAIG